MSRTAQFIKTKLLVPILVVIAAIGGGVAWNVSRQPEPAVIQVAATVPEPEPTTFVTYQGEAGKNALELLRQHADVQTSSSSIGDYVTAINGNDGGGTKYWLFYVNGQQANVGADAYVTKDGETLEWRLE